MAQEIDVTGASGFTIGAVIGSSFSVLFRNIAAFAAIAVLVSIPVAGLIAWGAAVLPFTVVGLSVKTENLSGAASVGVLLFMVLSLLTYLLIQSAVTYGTFQHLRNQKAGIGACIRRGLAVLPRVFVASVLLLIVLLGVLILCSIVISFVSAGLIASGSFAVSMWVSIVSTVVIFVVVVLIIVVWWVFVPAIVMERAGPIACFSRSRALTKGHRWGIFGLFVLIFGSNFLINLILQMMAGLAGLLAFGILSFVVILFFMALTSVMSAVGYYYLRAEKEGFGIDDIAKVFD